MRQHRIELVVLCLVLAGAAACHPGRRRVPPAPVVAQPNADLDRALRLFHRGDFRRAQTILQRSTFEFAPGVPELAQVRYYLAECSFQLGDLVQSASDFRKVADEFPTTEYAPLALLRAGDANLRLW